MLLQQSDLALAVSSSETLHIKRLFCAPGGEAVLMLHGMMANGRIFYSRSGKGLAAFLARAGYDVFVLDLRGHGGSFPPVSRHSQHGQTESICEDLPAVHARIREIKGDSPVHWMAHSWGGVLMSSCLLRHPELISQVKSCVYFASKRSVQVSNWHKWLKVDLVWNLIARAIVRGAGYLPAKRLRLGIDDESAKMHRQCNQWARVSPWVDSDDGFDYARAAQDLVLPPTLYFSAANDPCLGHPDDVRRFCAESGPHRSRLHLLGRATGHLHDYDHASLLTHPDAERDHFPLLLPWMSGPSSADFG
jgi:pimeloyl-ACP methyl ester carboxylesterase